MKISKANFSAIMFCAASIAIAYTPGTLEIHHVNIGQGDACLVIGPSGKTLLVDAGESYWNSHIDADTLGAYIIAATGGTHLDYALITHFQCDHAGYPGYGGLWNLVAVQGFTIGAMFHRDYANFRGAPSGTLTHWIDTLESTAGSVFSPQLAREGPGQIDLGTGVIVNITVVDGGGAMRPGDFSDTSEYAFPPSENDYAIGLIIKWGAFDEWIGGDLSGTFLQSIYGYSYHDIETYIAPRVGDMDVYKVDHHGSAHSSNATFVGQLDPEVSIISVGPNSYSHPTGIVLDRLHATSDVYMTGRGDTATAISDAVVAGHIVIKVVDGTSYTVNGIPYTATDPVRQDSDSDGYFAEVDPDDTMPSVIPAFRGGIDTAYQVLETVESLKHDIRQKKMHPSLCGFSASMQPVYDLRGRLLPGTVPAKRNGVYKETGLRLIVWR